MSKSNSKVDLEVDQPAGDETRGSAVLWADCITRQRANKGSQASAPRRKKRRHDHNEKRIRRRRVGEDAIVCHLHFRGIPEVRGSGLQMDIRSSPRKISTCIHNRSTLLVFLVAFLRNT